MQLALFTELPVNNTIPNLSVFIRHFRTCASMMDIPEIQLVSLSSALCAAVDKNVVCCLVMSISFVLMATVLIK
jgi:hypothetical protein